MGIWDALEHVLNAATHLADARSVADAERQAEREAKRASRPSRASREAAAPGFAGPAGGSRKKSCCNGKRIRLVKNSGEE